LKAFIDFDKVMPICLANISCDNFSQAKAGREKIRKAINDMKDGCSDLIETRWEYFSGINNSIAEKAYLNI
jgi:hypothetical protein